MGGAGCAEAARGLNAIVISDNGGDVTQETASILKVAAIQTPSVPGDIAASLAHGTALVEDAAGQGARLVVLPELFSCGYQPNKNITAND